MTTTFQRQANRLLADAGYEFVSVNGSQHEVWRKTGVPDIHVPGSPSGGRDSMLLRIRRAIRKGTALTPPSGQETDMPAVKKVVDGPPGEKLVKLASSYLLKVAEDKRYRREHNVEGKRLPDPKYLPEVGKWLERCIRAHGPIAKVDMDAAAQTLELEAFELSAARTKAKAAAYRLPGTDRSETWTDFMSRLPANATLFGGRGKKLSTPRADKGVKKVEEAPLPPPDPEHVGRRLERGGLTDEEHAAAERRMREAHLKAEQERQDILAAERIVAGPEVVVGESAANGVKSQLDIAMQLLREAALADTHAITPADIILLRGHHDTLLRTADDLRGMAASITSILVRVQAGLTAEGQPANG